jgi:hypothetical protein
VTQLHTYPDFPPIIGLGILFFSFASIILESNKVEVGSAWSSSVVYLGLYGLFVGFVFSLINARFNNKKEYPLFFSALFFFALLLYYKSYEFDFFNARIENIGYFFSLNLVVLSMLLIHFFCSLLIKNLGFEKNK